MNTVEQLWRDDRALTRLFRDTQLDSLLRRFADAFSVALYVEDGRGRRLGSAAPAIAKPTGAESMTHEVRAPLRLGGRDVGFVTVVDLTAFADDGGAAAVAELVADLVGDRLSREIESRDLTAELLTRYEEVNLLYDLSAALAAVFDVPTLCDIAVDRAISAVGAEHGAVVSVDPVTNRLQTVSVRGEATTTPAVLASHGVGGQVAASGIQLLLHPGQRWSTDDGQDSGEALLSVPLLRPGDVGSQGKGALGALSLVGKSAGGRFSAGTEQAVAIQNSRLVDSQRHTERARLEVEIAAGIQRGLLPARSPEIPGDAVAGMCMPATSVGGDYFDTLVTDADRLTLVIADVAGHSIGSALMMAMARIILRREVSDGHGPGAVLGATNRAMLDDLVRAGLFITAFCAQYDPVSRLLRYANAAHNLPFVCRAKDQCVIELDADGMPLGILEDVGYEERTILLAPGDTVLLYTDGVVEARDGGGEQFGDERLRRALVAGAPGTPRQLADEIFADVCRHLEGGTQQDDLTLVSLRVAAP